MLYFDRFCIGEIPRSAIIVNDREIEALPAKSAWISHACVVDSIDMEQ